jgi:hypothetical protein
MRLEYDCLFAQSGFDILLEAQAFTCLQVSGRAPEKSTQLCTYLANALE